MIDYEKLEQDICDVLNPVDGEGNQTNTLYEAKPIPDNESEVGKLFTKPKVFIGFCGSDFGEPESTEQMMQTETLTFEANIRAQSRKGESGIFAIIADVSARLMGYRFTGCKKIQLIKSGYTESTTQNNWNYILQFSFRTTIIENLPEPIVPTFQQIDNIHE